LRFKIISAQLYTENSRQFVFAVIAMKFLSSALSVFDGAVRIDIKQKRQRRLLTSRHFSSHLFVTKLYLFLF